MTKKLTCLLTALAMTAALTPCVALADQPYRADDGTLLDAGGTPATLDAQALASPDYSWYIGHEEDGAYTLTTPSQLVAFANLVNGADGQVATTFSGKAVALSPGRVFNFSAQEWTPIGDADHPFAGSFDGGSSTVDNFRISGADRSAYLGFFGYVGEGGSIANLRVGVAARIDVTRDAGSTDVMHHIGGVAGYCGGTIGSCSNAARITLQSGMEQTSDQHQVIYSVGGVAGECAFDVTGCTNAGAVTVSATSNPVGDVNDSGLVRYVGGVVGMLGDSTRVGTSETGAIAADASKHGAISDCSNIAEIDVDTPSTAGHDRFGAIAYARSMCVGGIAGYSQGSIANCTNGLALGAGGASSIGYIRAEHGTCVGGIAGSLRGLLNSDNPAQRAEEDDGMAGGGADSLAISECTNYGDVYALNAAGGIVGFAGTYTTIKNCVNSDKRTVGGSQMRTYVVATRWNKPSPAGIAGSTCGDVFACANFGIIASGTWTDEGKRTFKTSAGYYVAGIVGQLSYYEKVDKTAMTTKRVSPLPEVYGCYNAGAILADSGMRQRGIVGENEGHVHDNVLLAGTVDNDVIAYGGYPGDTEAHGTVANCTVMKADELKAADAVATLNASFSLRQWQGGSYWVKSVSNSLEGHYSYPVLPGSGAAPANRTDLSSGSAACTEGAHYNGGTNGAEAIPTLEVKLGAAALKPGIDFYIEPQAGAVEPGSGYACTVVGIGSYTGRISDVPYGIVAGYLAECTVSVELAKFNFEVQFPDKSSVTVRTADGAVVGPSEYEIDSLTDPKGKVTTEPVNRGNYTLTVKVREGSTHFSTDKDDTASGTYRIAPANIMTDIDLDKVTVTIDGKEYPWSSASDEEEPSTPKTVVSYTGSPIKPTLSAVTYNGHELQEGVDYRIVYGNPNPENGDTLSHDTENVGVRGGTGIGCVTIRYVTGSNFMNYENMFFQIVDDGTAAQEMYRLYNPNSGEHFYTASVGERDFLDSVGWNYEGVGWMAPVSSEAPVYRLYNQNGGEHHYTTGAGERDALVKAGWNDEGIGWYSAGKDGAPLYRQYNPNAFSCNHNYTTSLAENDWLVNLGWKAEGIGWYGVPQQQAQALTAAKL